MENFFLLKTKYNKGGKAAITHQKIIPRFCHEANIS